MRGADAARVARSPHAAVVREFVRAICAPPAVGPARFSMMAAGKFIDREANPKPPDRLARAIGVWCSNVPTLWCAASSAEGRLPR